jgi:hypothetical protein
MEITCLNAIRRQSDNPYYNGPIPVVQISRWAAGQPCGGDKTTVQRDPTNAVQKSRNHMSTREGQFGIIVKPAPGRCGPVVGAALNVDVER